MWKQWVYEMKKALQGLEQGQRPEAFKGRAGSAPCPRRCSPATRCFQKQTWSVLTGRLGNKTQKKLYFYYRHWHLCPIDQKLYYATMLLFHLALWRILLLPPVSDRQVSVCAFFTTSSSVFCTETGYTQVKFNLILWNYILLCHGTLLAVCWDLCQTRQEIHGFAMTN